MKGASQFSRKSGAVSVRKGPVSRGQSGSQSLRGFFSPIFHSQSRQSSSLQASSSNGSVRPASPSLPSVPTKYEKAELYLLRTDGYTSQRANITNSLLTITHPSTNQHMVLWKTKPRRVMILKRLGTELIPHVVKVINFLTQEGLEVVVEPSVAMELVDAGYENCPCKTWQKEQQKKLAEMVDFVVCLGGDGVILHASYLFRRHCPPIIAFNLGSMGFLANHDFATYESDLSDMIYGRTHRRALSDTVECACNDDSDNDGEESRELCGPTGTAAPPANGEARNGPSKDSLPSTSSSTGGGVPSNGTSSSGAAMGGAAMGPPGGSGAKNGWSEALQSLDIDSLDPPLDSDGLDVRLCRGTDSDEEGCAVLEEDEYGLPDEQLFPKAGVHVTIRLRLRCDVYKAGQTSRKPANTYHVLNEVVLDRGPSPYLCQIGCYESGRHFATVQADGLLLASPTGSTAYSLAAGGSMVHPSVPAILFTPICAHSLSSRPVILPDSACLELRVPDTARASVWASFDGKDRQELCKGDRIVVRMSDYPMPTVNRTDHSHDWFESLSRCLSWNERIEQKPVEAVIPYPTVFHAQAQQAALLQQQLEKQQANGATEKEKNLRFI